ncbi:solute carrier family 35 member G1-like isoform X1 [Clavelina lepadiformis]|uniref:solute carrier family 35 member G1-like isoform X1 n=1 Tax=Clavelina lepadiformis TaxID=159417 RepID=UPI004041CD2D
MRERNTSQSSIKLQDGNIKPKQKVTRSQLLGYFLAALSALANASSGICLKLAFGAEKTQMLVLRYIMQCLFLVPLLQYKKINLFGPDLKTVSILVARGATGSLSGLLFAMALENLSLGSTLSIYYVHPALVGFLACICLKEKYSKVRGILTLLTFVGLVFVSQPSFIFGGSYEDDRESSGTRFLGIVYSLSSAVFAAVCTVMIRYLGPGIHFSHSLIYTSLEGLLIVLLQLSLSGKPIIPCRQHLLILFLSASLMYLGQILFTLALQRERAGPIASIGTSQLVFGFLLEYLILGVGPTIYGFVGASLILVCAVSQSLESTVKTKMKSCKAQRKLKM